MSSMPANAPPYPPLLKTHVPYRCPVLPAVNVFCESSEKGIREILETTPFEYVTNRFTVSISDFSKCTWIPFMDAAVVIPVKFRDVVGGYFAYEYEDNESAVFAGRELWGYPKKNAKISLTVQKDHVRGTVYRGGVKLIDINCNLTQEERVVPDIKVYPHLLLQVIPRAEGPGVFLKRIIARDTSTVTKIKSKRFGEASISLGKLESDPIHRLIPVKVLGATFTISDFKATWGKVLATLSSES